jgi:hypothetical protein
MECIENYDYDSNTLALTISKNLIQKENKDNTTNNTNNNIIEKISENFEKKLIIEEIKSNEEYLYLSPKIFGLTDEDVEFIPADISEIEKLKLVFVSINNSDIIGLDSEWVVTKAPIKTTLFQIATRKKAYVFDLLPSSKNEQLKSNYINGEKNSFFEHFESLLGHTLKNEKVLKISWDFKQDMYNLNNRFKYSRKLNEIRNFIDLMPVAPKTIEKGLSNYCLHFLGSPLNKTFQKSAWDERPISLEQLIYAAMDSIVVIYLYEEMKKTIDIKPGILDYQNVNEEIKHFRIKKRGQLHLFSKWEY